MLCQFEQSSGACFAGVFISERPAKPKKLVPIFIDFMLLPPFFFPMIFPYFLITSEHFFSTRTQPPLSLPIFSSSVIPDNLKPAGVNIGRYRGLACEKGGQSRQTIPAILHHKQQLCYPV